ncbi:translational GTPase TypA [Gimesia aquarii]|uniref:Large ribosomal subunit assembly factor BipA n=1 Tax=Gimesia aquarii TaxID=2527964 RepID=A0A517VV86_9PLAN|nr:translational GTPase TypA [Gimesia aquarii]QDT96901.1 GTP-binding protein TypA/BipA [Gimesia aquarii]QDU10465.1 GTP-binding protein TypA/BipA [Gimesia aquarii]
MKREDVRNIAIIAHVDHGKTTLVDALLHQSGQFRDSQLKGDCILDSNDLERERGITILAKNIALMYKGVKVNIIDTPGHADFGGEVERVLRMADGVLILVDAFEGPRPQTRFVLKKALECHLKPVVVINKIDRPDCRPDHVLSEMFDLFVELDADDETLDFPYIYASAREGFATHDLENFGNSIHPLLDMVLENVPAPDVNQDAPLTMMVTTLEWSEYVGRVATGRISSGRVRPGEKVTLIKRSGEHVKTTVDSVELFNNLGRAPVDEASAGDIVALVGLDSPEIGDTVACAEKPEALTRIDVDEPTLSMLFTINSSPLAGQDGKYVTSRNLRERLMRELESNVALRVTEREDKDSFSVSGRGILHLSVLIEQMRREGYELSVGKPEVIRKKIDGKWHEPFESMEVDVPSEVVGSVMELVCARRGQMIDMTSGETGMSHLKFSIPARGLIGLRTRLLNATKGEAIINHRFEAYKLSEGEVPRRANGVLISQDNGQAVGYALWKLRDRAEFFIGPGEDVYEGMIVGENARNNDLVVNPIRGKKLTNVRASGSDENMVLKPPREMSLEAALEYIEYDEYVEITPKIIRLRKIYLTENERKRQHRTSTGE